MPTMKIEIAKRYGKFHFAVWEANSRAPDLFAGPEYGSIQEVVSHIPESLKKGMDPDNPVIFRQTAYPSFTELIQQVKSAQY